MLISKDIKLTEDGDLELGYDGDLAVVVDDDVLVQNIIFRLKTYKGDYVLEPDCGASLEELIGEPNTTVLGTKAEQMVTEALTHDGFLDTSQFRVSAVPLSQTKLGLILDVQGQRGTFTVGAELDLLAGRIRIAS
jgi:hypothetical protein